MTSGSTRRWERVIYALILLLAVFSRFYLLGERAMSHDESIHTKFSWNLYTGEGFQHNPMMHGPLLFELTALSYTFLGVSDFSSRVFTSLAGVALVMTPLLFRRWLGRPGALVTSALLLISPSILYYSRYVRHDVLLMLTAVLLLWTILKFVHTGAHRWLCWLAAAFSLMYATKEASYIYTAIFGILLLLPFGVQILAAKWRYPRVYKWFVVAIVMMLLLGAAFAASFTEAQVSELNLDEAGDSRVAGVTIPLWGRLAGILALTAFGVAVILIPRGLGSDSVARIRLLDILMVLGTLTLPLGSAFLIKFIAGVDMEVVYNAVRTGDFAAVPSDTLIAMSVVVFTSIAVSIGFGLWWDRKRWPVIALIHYAIFIVTYTTIFTWSFGALSGLVGGLAYWLAQQGVKRGNQPGYYYFLIGSLYEYLAIVLSVGAGVAAIVGGLSTWLRPSEDDAPAGNALTGDVPASAGTEASADVPRLDLVRLFPLFLVGWTLLSWIAYTYAGEKMPWLLVHITLPSVFLGGWGCGALIERVSGQELKLRPATVLLAATPLLLVGVGIFVDSVGAARAALGSGVASAGPTLAQLRPLGRAAGAAILMVVCGAAVRSAVIRLGTALSQRLVALLGVAILAVLTLRTSVMLNFINADLATELLVYAHGTPDIKDALERIREVSWAVTGTERDVKVAYGEDGSWPFTWYMVDFPNNYFYSTSPDATQLLASPVVIAGSPQYQAVEEILGEDYVHFDYRYLWWPIQDYYDLTWQRIWGALTDAQMRRALWDIVWRRDYELFARIKDPDNPFTLQSWPFRKDFRLYVRRTIAEQVWPADLPPGAIRYVEPVPTEPPDPFSAGERLLPELSRAQLRGAVLRGVAAAGGETFYVADTANHLVWRVGAEGVVGSFGGFGSAPGQFSEPWDVAVDGDGNIYVADTWNHRIQKFDADERYLTSWGGPVQVTTIDQPQAQGLFYGPRGLAVDNERGLLYVADTGNKRVQVFDLEGRFVREFGGGGRGAGQLDEPVGVDINADGVVAVADTWNRRVQLFDPAGRALRQWRIPTWDIANPDEKPFLAWSDELLLVTDPLGRRVLAFNPEGAYRWALGAAAGAELAFPQGLLVQNGTLYVADGHRGELLAFTLP